MKLRFESDLDFQLRAIEAVCDLYRGQDTREARGHVLSSNAAWDAQSVFAHENGGVVNHCDLTDAEILANLRRVQVRNGLPRSHSLRAHDFSVEMETGTGKTYVYLRTIFELNKRYGFSKFLVVVPSIAIKEGVYKALQITENHFRRLYAGVSVNYVQYDSSKMADVRHFVTSSQIQVMVVTVASINKRDVNNLYKYSERIGGARPIDLISGARPIVIVDEPQSVDGGLAGRGRAALEAMRPLCTLRYSATHTHKHHMVYRLDAVDAYQRKLVKQIEVASATLHDAHNRPYLRVVSTANRRGVITGRVEIDVETTGGVRRKEVTVYDGDDLEGITRRSVYRGLSVGEIRAAKGGGLVEVRTPDGEIFLRPGQASGDVDPASIQREMIRRTIREHLEKEARLHQRGIKVLSLFFVDAVSHYRQYDQSGGWTKGPCATMFEQEYRRLARHPAYRAMFDGQDVEQIAESIHAGYFSMDRKGRWTDSGESNAKSREEAARAYNLIMRDKEELLSFKTPLKFVFSHSALREGWDNPNVFQVCVLRDVRTERERRQTIGRGLRLCVNQSGERIRDLDANTLTVIARESYEAFADKLQHEVERDTGVRFGFVAPDQFATIATDSEGTTSVMGDAKSRSLYEYFRASGYIGSNGQIRDTLRGALKDGSLAVPESYRPYLVSVADMLRRLAGRIEIKNADERVSVRPRQEMLDSVEFRALWDRIKHKTTYRIEFDNDRLLTECSEAVRKAPTIPRTRIQWRKADIAIGEDGVRAAEKAGSATVVIEGGDLVLPDVLSELQDRTQLTRRSLYKVLQSSGRLDELRRNPQQFVERVAKTINDCKRKLLVDGIKYLRVGDGTYFSQELFWNEELIGYMRNVRGAAKSVYERVVYDSETEAEFADELEKNAAVRLYAKLPSWFIVPTPLGGYNPDWAVLIETDVGERLYLVVETKGKGWRGNLREHEYAKIRCGEAHFKALECGEAPAQYEVTTGLEELLARVDAA